MNEETIMLVIAVLTFFDSHLESLERESWKGDEE